jgi:menaquinone-9 beta-reductase
MSSVSRATCHLIIGGGLAGSMAATRLATAGREVTLLEKEHAAHHKVCGEFLSCEAVEYLRAAGVDPLGLGAATIRMVRLAVKQTVVEAPLPFTALSLSRHVLDEALLSLSAASGCEVIRGVHVVRLSRKGSEWSVQARDGELWRSPAVFLATGKHDVAGWERERGAQGDLVGFKLHWRLAPDQTDALRSAMELFLFAGGYGGLSLIENDAANLCLVVRRSRLRQAGGRPEMLMRLREENRHLALRLQGAAALWERPLAIFPIPYGYVAAPADGLWRLGDQGAVISSFTGDGMSIALHSGALAAQMILDGRTASEYQKELKSHLRRSMSLSMRLSQAMIANAGRSIAPYALSLFPSFMGWIARSTRIPRSVVAADATN